MKFTKIHTVALMAGLAGLTGVASASVITHTDSYGVKWTLSSDGVNYGNIAAPVYNVIVLADTTAFSTSSFTNTNAYINAVTVQAETQVTSGAVSGLGGSWTNVIGGQDQGGCTNNGGASGFDCAYFTAGNNPITAPGVLMSDNGASLEWLFALSFASGTTIDQALSVLDNGSHLKVDYYGYKTVKVCTGQGQSRTCTNTEEYSFLGQVSDNVTINNTGTPTPPTGGGNPIPEPETLALLGIGLLGMGTRLKRKAQH
ncbi:MAG: PEP-CTERM sorting domain-containing protein [Gammaproteobacteria bacterium]|nr:PEP-CTERM sorting domain-containing protein [Gammaproteobacteria bacterium]